jgi:hypothetical protein
MKSVIAPASVIVFYCQISYDSAQASASGFGALIDPSQME